MTLDVNIFLIPRHPDFEENVVHEISYLDIIVEEYFDFLHYEDPFNLTPTYSFSKFDTYSPIEKEISKAVFDLNSSEEAEEFEVSWSCELNVLKNSPRVIH